MGEYICPHCKNPIYDEEALLCHFCGESLQRPTQGFLGKMKYSGPSLFFVVIVLLILGLLFIFIF